MGAHPHSTVGEEVSEGFGGGDERREEGFGCDRPFCQKRRKQAKREHDGVQSDEYFSADRQSADMVSWILMSCSPMPGVWGVTFFSFL